MRRIVRQQEEQEVLIRPQVGQKRRWLLSPLRWLSWSSADRETCFQDHKLLRSKIPWPLVFLTRALVMSGHIELLLVCLGWYLEPLGCQQIIPVLFFLQFISISRYHSYSALIDIYKLGIARKSTASSMGRLGWTMHLWWDPEGPETLLCISLGIRSLSFSCQASAGLAVHLPSGEFFQEPVTLLNG